MSKRGSQPRTLRQYLRVAEAAQLLGVSASTLRNWDRQGKLKAARHPMNRYRLYDRDELLALLKGVARGQRQGD
ncbi:MAG: MerR family DNA-binding transcriptional regulator [Planctomycetes bacterium]|nr:MerR family DNA-binding transcriptional regulator [Planctomycetota bacterium]